MSSTQKPWDPKDDEDEEDDDQRDETEYTSMKDATIFAIEVSDSMLEVDEDEMETDEPKKKKKEPPVSNVIAAIKCAFQLLQHRIISSPKDMIGILLFGTKETKFEGGNCPSCYTLLDLDIPEANDIKRLRNLLEGDEEFKEALTPSTEPWQLQSVLFAANILFTTRSPNFNSRRLFIVTDNDAPYKEPGEKTSAATRAKDLYDLGVVIEPFFMSSPSKAFDPKKFYNDLIYATDDGEPMTISTDTSKRFEEMSSALKSKRQPKRAVFSTKLEIGPGFVVGVKGYITVKEQKPIRSHFVYTGGEKLKFAKSHGTKMVEETAKEVQPAEIRKAYKFGGEPILFTQDEFKEMRNFGDPVIRILGFKPLFELELWENMRPAYFIYPSEEDYVGSTRVFAALWKNLLEKKKMGIVWFIPRKHAAPVRAALIPAEEKLGDDGKQAMPPGLYVITLPFEDDKRKNPEFTRIEAPDTLIDKARKIVQQLHKPKGFQPEKFQNPALQWHYKVLQALALEEELPEPIEDQSLPKYKLIKKHAADAIQDWGEELENTCQSMSNMKIEAHGIKREASQTGAAVKGTKKAKTDAGEVDDKEMKEHYNKKTLGKFTVAILKDWLDSKGLPTGGKKADLIERVEDYFEKK